MKNVASRTRKSDNPDEYVSNLLCSVFHADDLVFDESVWATRQEFLKWVSP